MSEDEIIYTGQKTKPGTALPDNGLPVVVIDIDETEGHTIEDMNKNLETLMDEVYSIDYSAFGSKPEGKVRLMEKAYDRAATVD